MLITAFAWLATLIEAWLVFADFRKAKQGLAEHHRCVNFSAGRLQTSAERIAAQQAFHGLANLSMHDLARQRLPVPSSA